MKRQYDGILAKIRSDPAQKNYTDISLTPVVDEEVQELEVYSASDSAKAAVAKAKRQQEISAMHVAS